MKYILVIGAGRSASCLIKYLLDQSASGGENWSVTVADVSLELAKQKTSDHPSAKAIAFDINNEMQRHEEISKADLVVSMLPAALHLAVAKDCVAMKKHLVTASYVSKEVGALDTEAKKNGVILMNEIGLDPGIDHASAMKVIDELKAKGEELISFKSYCGGLVAPESNDNPWGYKFSWNPRNVILAGQGGDAQYIENGEIKYIPYQKLFVQTEMIEADEHGFFEAYANRDSLSYRKPYGLDHIPTMLRGTLRMPGYCKAWNALIMLGLTDDSKKIMGTEKLTWKELMQKMNPSLESIAGFLGEKENSEVMQKLNWLELFSDRKINVKDGSPAQILQELLEEKWKLKKHDKDMIVMQHQFSYKGREAKDRGQVKKIISSLVVKGEDQIYTAMAKTVGLPAAITAKLILQGKIKARGVVIPTIKEIYDPVLTELETFGIKFTETEIT